MNLEEIAIRILAAGFFLTITAGLVYFGLHWRSW
jgi:hypothetical protein